MVDNIKQICVELANLAKRKHYFCEDSWYSCPKAEEGCANDAEGDECTCGADAHNAKVNELLAATLPGGASGVDGSAPRIFVYPGHVVSRTDGDSHFISARRLAELYGVRLRDCIIVDKRHSHGYEKREGDIHLYPRSDGDYRRALESLD